jgi:arabinofuranosyltransferase
MLWTGIAGGLLFVAWHKAAARWAGSRALNAVPWVALGAALLVGLTLVVARASVFDDAFISFRFVENFLHGHGLVWNLGERVEGYTNFLWVMLVAGASALTGVQPAETGLWASLLVFPLNLLAVFVLERALARADAASCEPPRATAFLPIATLFLAVQDSFVTAGTSGLETGFAALLVTAGTLSLVRAQTPLAWARTGLIFILATLTRPDHAIFYALASLVLALEQGLLLFRERAAAWPSAWRHVLAFSAPALLVVLHTAFRYAFYGELVPNTYFVKADAGSWFSQGFVYAASFYLASHLWLTLPFALGWALWPTQDLVARRFKLFFLASFVVYNAYVMKVGGDFMFGRFYVTLLPLILIAAARAVFALGRLRVPLLAYALVALLAASARGVSIIAPGVVAWGICDEHTLYPVTRWHPLAINHSNFRVGQTLRGWRDAGLHLRVATSGIGMVGYYSRMEVIDLMGLTDAYVAHQPLKRRGRPGHEKKAEPGYIEKRMPHLVRDVYHPGRHEQLTRLQFGGEVTHRPWYIYHFDREVMARIKQLSPKVRFKPFDAYLRGYSRELRKQTPKAIRDDQRFFGRYYFDHNDDPKLLERWHKAVQQQLEGK